MGVLLNRLAFNAVDPNSSASFRVQLSEGSEFLETPFDFIQALDAQNHLIEVCPRVHISSFGFGLCVLDERQEEGPKWFNIPLAVCSSSGIEDARGRPLNVFSPHGCLELLIKGPFVNCFIKHYQGIEKFTG
jgi:hypothetical protein